MMHSHISLLQIPLTTDPQTLPLPSSLFPILSLYHHCSSSNTTGRRSCCVLAFPHWGTALTPAMGLGPLSGPTLKKVLGLIHALSMPLLIVDSKIINPRKPRRKLAARHWTSRSSWLTMPPCRLEVSFQVLVAFTAFSAGVACEWEALAWVTNSGTRTLTVVTRRHG